MKHPDSETLKTLKDKAETDPIKAVDDLLGRVLSGAGREKPGTPKEGEAS
ncbi:MAG: hypothetical protein OXN89_00725 [Bryobacterales bacterium]|nr:hypothetical protein [Bryobacterales bacterium]